MIAIMKVKPNHHKIKKMEMKKKKNYLTDVNYKISFYSLHFIIQQY